MPGAQMSWFSAWASPLCSLCGWLAVSAPQEEFEDNGEDAVPWHAYDDLLVTIPMGLLTFLRPLSSDPCCLWR